MTPFLSRYLTSVDDYLGDPAQAKRYPEAVKLKDLRKIEVMVWERLLRASGQQSTIGRTEIEVTLQNNVAFYPLPGNFRQFIGFEYRDGGDRKRVTSWLPSVSMYDGGAGVEILDGQRGMMIHPTPVMDGNQNWTLIYMKGPVMLHYNRAFGYTNLSVTGWDAPPPGYTARGEISTLVDYYRGCLLRVYNATTGAGQVREISAFAWPAGKPVYTLREAFTPIPTGTLDYEIIPALPEPYDEIYALEAAIAKCGSVGLLVQKQQLLQDHAALWQACKSYFQSNVADRMPKRSARLSIYDPDPYPEV